MVTSIISFLTTLKKFCSDNKYQELFPAKFSEMKGIIGDLGVMKIPIKPDVKLIKQKAYRLNLKYMKKVKIDLDKMIATRIIEPVEELEWVSLMVVQGNKT